MGLINFVYSGNLPDGGYVKILDSIIDPIIKHLPPGTAQKINWPNHSHRDLNVCFFKERRLSAGSQVFISHGIADKNWRHAWDVAHFEHVFVSGEAWKNRLLRQGRGLTKERIHIGGYPKMDSIFQGKIKRRRKNKGEGLRILWAPTHNAVPGISSHPDFEQYLSILPGTVLTALHPANRKDKTPTMQFLVDADIVIADAGSLLYEAWSLNKPVIFPDWLIKEGVMKQFHASYECLIFERNIGIHAKSIEHMIEIINSMRENVVARKLNEQTKSFIDAIFPPELRGCSGKVTADILRGLANL